jgi:HEAT repeat protein
VNALGLLLLVCASGTPIDAVARVPDARTAAPGPSSAPSPDTSLILSPATDEIDELERDLAFSGDWWESKRRSAVRKLADIGTPRAWELVLGALEQSSAQVADEAELALARLGDKKLLQALLGAKGLGHKEFAVRVRAAEACGRCTADLDAGVLAREARTAKEPELRRTLAWTLERRAAAGRIAAADVKRVADALSALVRQDAAHEVRGAALGALAALQREAAAPEIAKALADKSPVLRCAGLESALVLGSEKAVAEATRLADAPELAVRTAAVDRLAALASRAAVIALARRLEKEQAPALAWRLRDLMRELSGVEQSWEPAAWRHWAESLPETWEPPRRDGAPRTSAGGARSPSDVSGTGIGAPTLIGLPVVSARLAILVDLSGSVWDTARDGKTRKQLLDEELRKALEQLPSTSEFNLIPYTAKPIPWAKELQPATPANVERALAWFEARRDRGPGNYWDAALLALEDPKVDTILALTDGAPTGGPRWNMELMTEWLAQENRFRRARFDSILVDAPKGLQKHWQRLAEQSHGLSIAVEMKEKR